MRSLTSVLLVLLSACGDDTRVVRGFLVPGSDVTDVYVVGQALRGVVEGDSFAIAGIAGDTVQLEFAEEGERLGRMRIEQWSSEKVELRGIWLDEETAYATALGGEGAAVINGLRMAPEAALPERVSVTVTVLAASEDSEALIVRPDDPALPDLRVVVTPGTAVRFTPGESGDRDLNPGDSLRVEGTIESGYVVATELVLSRSSTAGEDPEWEATGMAADRGGEAWNDEDEHEGARRSQRRGDGNERGRGSQRAHD